MPSAFAIALTCSLEETGHFDGAALPETDYIFFLHLISFHLLFVTCKLGIVAMHKMAWSNLAE